MARHKDDGRPARARRKAPKRDPLYRFPWRLPQPAPGEVLDLVELMSEQVRKHPPGTPHSLDARFELLRALSWTGRLDEAVALVDELMAEELPNERRCEALMSAGVCAEKAGRFDVAVRTYRRLIELRPETPDACYFARNNLAYSLNQLGEFEEAMALARQAIEIAPKRHNAHKNLAVALEGLGMLEQAAEAYLRSTYMQPVDRRAYNALVKMVEKHPELLEKLDHLGPQIEFCKSVMRVVMAPRH